MTKDAEDIHHGSFRQEALPERTEILEQLNVKVREYSKPATKTALKPSSLLTNLLDDLLIQHSALRTHPKVPERNKKSIQNWFYNSQNAILESEAAYISKEHDLIQLVPKPTTPLRRILEKSTAFRLSKFWAKKPPDLPVHNTCGSTTTYYSSDANIDAFIGIIITTAGTVMLIAPLWILEAMESPVYRLGVITCFIVLFLALVAFTMPTNPLGSSAAVAAYSAVLVVFLQIGNGGGQLSLGPAARGAA